MKGPKGVSADLDPVTTPFTPGAAARRVAELVEGEVVGPSPTLWATVDPRRTPEACCSCRSTRWWRRRGPSLWTCSACHPAPYAPDSIEHRDGEVPHA